MKGTIVKDMRKRVMFKICLTRMSKLGYLENLLLVNTFLVYHNMTHKSHRYYETYSYFGKYTDPRLNIVPPNNARIAITSYFQDKVWRRE